MSQKSFSEGSSCPNLGNGILRLYSMRFCPYAQRTRIVLAHYNIKHEVVNVDLKSKPQWFLDKNPLGLVPVLEQDGKIIYESEICDEYLDRVYGNGKLVSADPYEAAKHRMLLSRFGKSISLYYGILFAKDKTPAETEESLNNFITSMQPLEQALTGKYFAGDNVGMIDFNIWPWIERLSILEKHVGGTDILKKGGFVKLPQWIADMKALPAIKATIFDDDSHMKFYQSYVNGKPDYDMGL